MGFASNGLTSIRNNRNLVRRKDHFLHGKRNQRVLLCDVSEQSTKIDDSHMKKIEFSALKRHLIQYAILMIALSLLIMLILLFPIILN